MHSNLFLVTGADEIDNMDCLLIYQNIINNYGRDRMQQKNQKYAYQFFKTHVCEIMNVLHHF